MRTYTIDVTAGAFAPIHEAYEYIKSQSPQNAERWLVTLYEKVRTLRTMPTRCGLIRENEAFAEDVRELRHFSHRVIFTVDEDRSVVLVHAVASRRACFSRDVNQANKTAISSISTSSERRL